jgi:exodeoxyribonuclease V alpha subunit
METVRGKIVQLSRSYNSGWRFGSLHPEGSPDISIVGNISESIEVGDCVVCSGDWKQHPKYGPQFQVQVVEVDIPRDVAGIQEYLDRHFMWIGPVLSRKLTDKFGDTIFQVLEESPEKLSSISGITPKRAASIHEEYLLIKQDREHDIFFATNGITARMRDKLVAQYGSKQEAIKIVSENPYELSDTIWGVGFKKCDAIAGAMGIAKDSSHRIRSGVNWVLGEASEGEGHCYLPENELLTRSIEVLGIHQDHIKQIIEYGVKDERLIRVNGGIYRRDLHRAETDTAGRIRNLTTAPCPLSRSLPASIASGLDETQIYAVKQALDSRISIITGFPGTGKTHTVRRILDALSSKCIELAAPTGKAAKRMAEMCGRPAQTIHRLLQYSPQVGDFLRNRDNPIEADTIIIDESSMVDIRLMASLMDAVTDKQKIIFVGDVNQLPSVGPGQVLNDMIQSECIPVTYLTQLYRQDYDSLINVNAQRIHRGEKLELSSTRGDFWFIPEEDPHAIPGLIIKAVEKIPQQFGFSYDDIQVLCPQKKGPVGTGELNKILQPILNPTGEKLPGVPFRSGDRVIQTRNNYDLEIFNGDIGVVRSVDQDYLYVQFDDISGKRNVAYPLTDLDDLRAAWALTVHKSQGSEYPVVIMPIHTTNFIMLKRNLLYTAITRARKLVVLVGTMKAANLAIRTVDTSRRYTGLAGWIRGEE